MIEGGAAAPLAPPTRFGLKSKAGRPAISKNR
jgi:hypothetical protein